MPTLVGVVPFVAGAPFVSGTWFVAGAPFVLGAPFAGVPHFVVGTRFVVGAHLGVRPDAVRPDGVLKLPIRLRDQVLGVIEARKPDHAGPWSQDEIEQLTSLVDQLSVTLENARLYEDTQNRAEHERILAEITTKVRATTDINTIMQTAMLELATALNVPQGAIRLQAAGPYPPGIAPDGGSANEQ